MAWLRFLVQAVGTLTTAFTVAMIFDISLNDHDFRGTVKFITASVLINAFWITVTQILYQ